MDEPSGSSGSHANHNSITLTPIDPMTFTNTKDGSKYIIKDIIAKKHLTLFKIDPKGGNETYVGYVSYDACVVDAFGNAIVGKAAVQVGYLLITEPFRTKKLSYLLGAAMLSKVATWYNGDISIAKLIAIKPDPELVGYWVSVGLEYAAAQVREWQIFKQHHLGLEKIREENEKLKESEKYDPFLNDALGPTLDFDDATFTTTIRNTGTVHTSFVMQKPEPSVPEMILPGILFNFLYKTTPVQVLTPTYVEVDFSKLNAKVAAGLKANNWKIEGASVRK